jgi:hypothetical protein
MLISKQTLANCVFCKKELSTIFSNWKLKNQKWYNFWWKYDFVIQAGEIKIWQWHSYIADWGNVDFAWELTFNNNTWILTEFSNGSWHYKPIASDKSVLFDLLKKKWIDTSTLRFVDRSSEF